MDSPVFSILLIDEDQRSSSALAAMLTRHNHTVQMVSSGKEGYIAALRDRPAVIILDAGLGDMPAAELLRKLRGDKRTARCICIAISDSSLAGQRMAMLAAGCNEFILKTPESIETLLALLASPSLLRISPTTPRPKRQRTGGVLGVFLSAKGGVGTSSLCANIAQNLAITYPSLDVAVMDLVFPMGSLASIVGYEAVLTLDSAAQSLTGLNSDFLHRSLAPLENWGFRLLAGSAAPDVSEALDMPNVVQLPQVFQQAFDFTVIDLGRSLSSDHLSIIQEADVIVIVTGADLSTVHMTRTLCHYLKGKGIDAKRLFVLLNRSTGLDGLGKSDAERILEMDVRAVTPYFAGNFALANSQHLPITVKLPNDTAAMMIGQISRDILETARRNRA